MVLKNDLNSDIVEYAELSEEIYKDALVDEVNL